MTSLLETSPMSLGDAGVVMTAVNDASNWFISDDVTNGERTLVCRGEYCLRRDSCH